MKKMLMLIVLSGTCLIFSNCASIIHGTTQRVGFSSNPSGAKIYINDQYYGDTPKTLNLRRKGFAKGQPKNTQYAVKIEMDGYYPYETQVRRTLSGWLFGNIIFGGIIGIVVDAANGAMYNLRPDEVRGQLNKNSAMQEVKSDGLYIAVTLDIDPSWQKIGYLHKR